MKNRETMNDRLTIKLDENLKGSIKESAEVLDLTASEFIRVLYLCYKFSRPEDKTSLSKAINENLWNYRASLKK